MFLKNWLFCQTNGVYEICRAHNALDSCANQSSFFDFGFELCKENRELAVNVAKPNWYWPKAMFLFDFIRYWSLACQTSESLLDIAYLQETHLDTDHWHSQRENRNIS